MGSFSYFKDRDEEYRGRQHLQNKIRDVIPDFVCVEW